MQTSNEEKERCGICENCSSKNYCINRERGVRKCINYNKFPSEKKDKV